MLVCVVDQLMNASITSLRACKHLGQFLALPRAISEVIYQRHDLQIGPRGSDKLRYCLLFPWPVRVFSGLLTLLNERTVVAVEMKKLTDEKIEILDVLFERAHARLV